MNTVRRLRVPLVVLSVLLGVAALAPAGPAASDEPMSPDLRLNHIQVKGSHNSYHIEPPMEVVKTYMAFQSDAYTLSYTHEPLPVQFEEQGVRQIELDVVYDPSGKYPPEVEEGVNATGFKVMHIEQADMESTCPMLLACLQQVADWSAANPRHVPITVLLEMKDTDDIPAPPAPDPIDADALREMDDLIRSVFDEDRLVTPDFLRGVGREGGADGEGTVYDTPNDAVTGYGWPKLEDVRGRVLFVLDNKRSEYVDGDPTLAGRVAFPPSVAGAPDAAFLKLNNSISDPIQQRVAEGYLVRSRADFPVETGLSGDATNREAALSKGAHFVSGDYLTPTAYERYNQEFADFMGIPFDPDRPPYETVVPGGTPARCNPITAPPGCTSALIENLDATVPGPPTEVEAVVGDGQVEVRWSAPLDDGGLPVTAYTVVTDGGAPSCTVSWIAAGAGAADPYSCVFEGLTNGRTYEFTATATNAVGSSVPSAPVWATPTACGTGGDGPFADVSSDSVFCGDVEWLVAAGVTGGFLDGTFGPTLPVSRQSMAGFLYRWAGSPEGEDPACEEAPFDDVAPSNPFCGEIAWLVAEGIAGGFLDGTYRPQVPVSRQSMAGFLYRWAGSPEGEDPACEEAPFDDVATSNPFCGEIAWLVAEGIAGGFLDGTYRPGLPVSRQAMASFLHAMDD